MNGQADKQTVLHRSYFAYMTITNSVHESDDHGVIVQGLLCPARAISKGSPNRSDFFARDTLCPSQGEHRRSRPVAFSNPPQYSLCTQLRSQCRTDTVNLRSSDPWGRYRGGRRPSSDDSFHSPTVIPPSALDKPSIMNHRRRTTR